MGKLPLHVKLDHLRQIGRSDIVVESGLPFRLVERAANRIAREFRAEISIECEETIEPMQAVAVEGAAHVKKDCANHRLIGHRLARNLRSALRCQSQSATNARFIGSRTNAKNRSIRCRHTNTPMA